MNRSLWRRVRVRQKEYTRRVGGCRVEARSRAAALILPSMLLMAALGLAGCGTAGTSAAESSVPATEVVSPSTTQTSPTTTSTPTTAPGYPVLSELPRIALEDLALVEIRNYDAQALNTPPSRILSPVGDADMVKALLTAYAATVLKPEAGFPQLDQNPLYGFMSVVLHLNDGSYVHLEVGREQGLVVVGHQAKELTPQDSASPSAVGYSPDLAPLAESIAQASSQNFSSGFALPQTMPEDFALVLAYGVTLRNVLDTAAGTFTKDLISSEVPTATTALMLSAEELKTIYAELRKIDIAGYAGLFHPKDTTGWRHTPFEAYYLHMRVAGQEKEISWEDEDDSAAPDAVALRDLFKRIRAMIEAKPEYKSLPAAEGGYA
jgi:hypothetical protein